MWVRERGDSLTQEQAEGQFPGACSGVWVPALLHSACVRWGEFPNLSVPWLLVGKGGGDCTPTVRLP